MNTARLHDDRRRLLRIYLNDHLMGAVAGTDLARRCLRSNSKGPLAVFLQQLLDDILDDRRSLENLMARLELPIDRVKLTAGSIAEKLGRLKMNGRLLGYSDLSRLLELEGLCAGVALKLRLWQALEAITDTDVELAATDLAHLARRATAQLEALEHHRLQAATRAFGTSRPAAS